MTAGPRVSVRPAAPGGMEALAALLAAYMRETYDAPWNGSADALRRDALGQRCVLLVALEPGGGPVGFLAWTASYDLHHCVSGAEALDLYVEPRWRGRGVALLLACAAAAEVARRGGLFLRGTVVETGPARRLYRRIGVCDGAGCVVSGRAFRRLAELAGRPLREAVRSLPDPSWNHEP